MDASTIPSTIGRSVTYTSLVSFCRMMKSDRSAVKKGVVAPMAWLNDTGMNRRLMFPPTTDATKTTARTATLMACRRDLRFCRGAMPAVRTAKARWRTLPCGTW